MVGVGVGVRFAVRVSSVCSEWDGIRDASGGGNNSTVLIAYDVN